MSPSRLRCVIDTNVILSALFFESGKPGRAVRKAISDLEVLASLETLLELSEVLSRPRFDRYLSRAEREEFLRAFTSQVVLVEPTVLISACRDPKDDKFLELAVSGGARSLITGDSDLLALDPF